MIEVINEQTTPEFESKMLKEYISGLSEYTKKIKDCDECKLYKLCGGHFSTCPKSWKSGVVT